MAEPNPILAVGTQVVARVEAKGAGGTPVHPRGAVGVVVQSPADYWHSYRVRFTDGFEAAFKRAELAILAHYKGVDYGQPADPLAEYDLYQHVIFSASSGRALTDWTAPDSDTDRRGIYLPPAELHWSLYGVPEQLENDATQEAYWELQKFLMLALKANPNVLECLYTPLVETADAAGRGAARRCGRCSSRRWSTRRTTAT